MDLNSMKINTMVRVKGMWTHTNTRKDKFDMFRNELLDMLVGL